MALKGKNLSLTINGDEINAEITQAVLDNEDQDAAIVTFADVASGDDKQWFFTITAVSDYASGSFWETCYTNAGTDVAYSFKPYGNATASTAQPHFTGNVTLVKPPVGGSANEYWTFEVRLDCTEAPTMVTA